MDEVAVDIAGLYGSPEERSPLLPEHPMSYVDYIKYIQKPGELLRIPCINVYETTLLTTNRISFALRILFWFQGTGVTRCS